MNRIKFTKILLKYVLLRYAVLFDALLACYISVLSIYKIIVSK